jgi:hypothetical protein
LRNLGRTKDQGPRLHSSFTLSPRGSAAALRTVHFALTCMRPEYELPCALLQPYNVTLSAISADSTTPSLTVIHFVVLRNGRRKHILHRPRLCVTNASTYLDTQQHADLSKDIRNRKVNRYQQTLGLLPSQLHNNVSTQLAAVLYNRTVCMFTSVCVCVYLHVVRQRVRVGACRF